MLAVSIFIHLTLKFKQSLTKDSLEIPELGGKLKLNFSEISPTLMYFIPAMM